MAGADLRRLYRRWMLELWNGDLSVAAEIVTDDFVVHQARADGARSEELRGPGAVVRMVREGHAPFEGLSFEIEVGPVVEGDLVAARWVGRGRYRGGPVTALATGSASSTARATPPAPRACWSPRATTPSCSGATWPTARPQVGQPEGGPRPSTAAIGWVAP
jgi:hypothetical protein